MEKRLEKFNMEMSDVSAHTMNIIEIIEQQKQVLQNKKQRKLEAEMNNG